MNTNELLQLIGFSLCCVMIFGVILGAATVNRIVTGGWGRNRNVGGGRSSRRSSRRISNSTHQRPGTGNLPPEHLPSRSRRRRRKKNSGNTILDDFAGFIEELFG